MLLALAAKSQSDGERVLVYIGTYTKPAPHVQHAKGRGISVYELDPNTGNLTFVSETVGIEDPTFLAISRDQRFLYAASEVPQGMVYAYAIDSASGGLRLINSQSAHGSSTAHVMVDPTGRIVVAANYAAGNTFVVYRVRDDGGIEPASDHVRHEGRGVHPRQEKTHGHSTYIDPSNRYLCVVDLGIDAVKVYALDREKGRVRLHSEVKVQPGSGVRHLAFHPNGKFAYVIGELNSTITTLGYDGEGNFTVLDAVSTLPDDFSAENNSCSEIAVHPSGKFLYGANRWHDTLVMFQIDPETGKLALIGHQPTLGKTTRHFAIDPTGRLMLVGNQDSDNVVTFWIDLETGKLTHTGVDLEIATPVCFRFLTVN